MERPGSVTVVAILQIVFSVFGILGSLLLFLGGAFMGSLTEDAEGAAIVGGVLVILSLFSLVLSLASLVFAIGLLQLKTWGWIGTLIVRGLDILVGLLYLIGQNYLSIIGVIISGVIIWVLLQPEVKRAFGQG